MIRRVFELTRFYIQGLVFSLAGIVFIIFAFLFWAVFFPPGQGTPDAENYFIIIGAFGAALAFLATLTTASRANRAENLPLLARLPSRVEYVTAVFSSALIFALLLQLIIAGLALIRGPELSAGMLLEAPPIWIGLDLLAAIMALHASDLVASGWSRVIIYGGLAVLLIGQNFVERLNGGLASLAGRLSGFFYARQLEGIAGLLGRATASLSGAGESFLERLLNLIFWPFQAIVNAVLRGYFTPTQALAPAVLVLYATVLFLIAADLFASKDLELVE